MEKLICTLLIFIILILGCNPTYSLYPLNSERCTEINKKALGRDATLTIEDSVENMEVENIIVRVDSSYWIDRETGLKTSVPTSLIKEITITDKTTGFLYGLIGTGVSIMAIAAVAGEENQRVHGRQVTMK